MNQSSDSSTQQQRFDVRQATEILDTALHRAAADLPVTAEGVLNMLTPTLRPATAKCEWFHCPGITATVPIWQYAWGKAHDVCAAARDQVLSELRINALAKLCVTALQDSGGEAQVSAQQVQTILTQHFPIEVEVEAALNDYDLNAR